MVGVKGANAKGVLYVDDIAFYKHTPASEQVVSWFEAESGNVAAPMQVYSNDPSASAGQYIGTEDAGVVGDRTDGVTTYNFTVQGGTYKLIFRVITGTTDGSNSFWVRIPDATAPVITENDGWINTNPMSYSETWIWDVIGGNDAVEFTIPAGTHTLQVAYREDGAYLDAIAIVLVTE
ncbi:hypothetical protein AMJ86_02610 [bacterium SM23_57]|nr:MAG: hypothetical protein AMJ86_02610 [bacterium SM23_57]